MSFDRRYLPNRPPARSRFSGVLTPRRVLLAAVVLILLAVAYVGSRGSGTPDAEELADEVARATELAGYGGLEVSVDGGEVVITGSVATEQDRFAVEKVARSVSSVVTVDNRVAAEEAVTDEETDQPVGTATAPAIDLQARLSGISARDPIQFASASAQILGASDPTLEEIASLLTGQPDIDIEVGGHTDSDGEEAANLDLSEQRAAAVVTRLGELGVDTARLTAVGYGEQFPIADNTTQQGKERNRRIEFRVIA